MFQMTSPCFEVFHEWVGLGPLGRKKLMSTSRPPCALTNLSDCTNRPDPQHSPSARRLLAHVVALNGNHGAVDALTNGWLLCIRLKVGPSGFFGHPDDLLNPVLVRVLSV